MKEKEIMKLVAQENTTNLITKLEKDLYKRIKERFKKGYKIKN